MGIDESKGEISICLSVIVFHLILWLNNLIRFEKKKPIAAVYGRRILHSKPVY